LRSATSPASTARCGDRSRLILDVCGSLLQDLRAALKEARRFDALGPCRKGGGRTGPLQRVHVAEQSRVGLQYRERLEQQRELPLVAEHAVGERLDRAISIQQLSGGHLADPWN